MIEPQAQKRGIGMTFPRFEIPYFVKADRTRVKQVLINLLFNAIKYNKPGGSVAVECALSARIRFVSASAIPVRDWPRNSLAQLFQPFNRLGQESRAEEGTGIGLVVTKRLVELMGGAIGADSTVGVGSVFWIELRLTSAPQLAGYDVERGRWRIRRCRTVRRCARCSMWRTIPPTWNLSSNSLHAVRTCAC